MHRHITVINFKNPLLLTLYLDQQHCDKTLPTKVLLALSTYYGDFFPFPLKKLIINDVDAFML